MTGNNTLVLGPSGGNGISASRRGTSLKKPSGGVPAEGGWLQDCTCNVWTSDVGERDQHWLVPGAAINSVVLPSDALLAASGYTPVAVLRPRSVGSVSLQ